MYLGKNTSRPSKCASKASARSGLHLFSEMLAFQRACRVSRHAQRWSIPCGMDHLSGFQESSNCDVCKQEPRRVPSSADDGIKLKLRFFRGHAPREKHFSGRKCASSASARRGLHLFSEMLAFLRERVEFLDTLNRPGAFPESSGAVIR